MRMRKKLIIAAIVIFVVVFAWGYYGEAWADELRLGVGKGFTNDNDWTSMEFTYSDRNWYAQAAAFGGDDSLPDTWRLSAGYRVDWRQDTQWAPFMRLGAAYFLETPDEIISHPLGFDMAIGLRIYKTVELEWQHNSTAGRSRQNSGNDMLVVSIPFQL